MSKWRNTLQNRTAKLATKSYIRFIFGSRVFKPLIASVLKSDECQRQEFGMAV